MLTSFPQYYQLDYYPQGPHTWQYTYTHTRTYNGIQSSLVGVLCCGLQWHAVMVYSNVLNMRHTSYSRHRYIRPAPLNSCHNNNYHIKMDLKVVMETVWESIIIELGGSAWGYQKYEIFNYINKWKIVPRLHIYSPLGGSDIMKLNNITGGAWVE